MQKGQGILTLTRKVGESIMIGDGIEVTLTRIESGGQVRLAIKAPPDMEIMRKELLEEAAPTRQPDPMRLDFHP